MLHAAPPRPSRTRRRRRRTTTLTLALAATLALTLAPATGSAQAADIGDLEAAVRSAEATAQAARDAAGSSADALAEGTARWEAGKKVLAGVQDRARAARARVAAAEAETAAQRKALGAFAAAAYRNPVNPELQVVLTSDREDVPAALSSLAQVANVGRSGTDVLDRLRVAELSTRDAQAEQARLLARADAQTKDLAAQVARLTATATATAERLDTAEAGLATARGRLADAEAARAAASAERDRLARAAASRAASSGATCTGASTGGYSNGALPPEALCPLDHAPGHRLRADAAAAFNRMTAAALAERGTPLCVTDSYRSYSEQVDVYRRKPGLAATPGKSNHGWGLATDLCGGAETFGTSTYQWLKANAGRYGFGHPAWAEPGGSKPEPWHWEFGG